MLFPQFYSCWFVAFSLTLAVYICMKSMFIHLLEIQEIKNLYVYKHLFSLLCLGVYIYIYIYIPDQVKADITLDVRTSSFLVQFVI